MGFKIDDMNDEYKQHINLTDVAWLAIHSDLDNLNIERKRETFSGFLNRIFHNFYPKSVATISVRCREYKHRLSDLLLDESLPDDIEQVIYDKIDQLTDNYAAELRDAALAPYMHLKGRGAKFRINNENLEILSLIDESEYYSSVGIYMKAVFEEYARLEEGDRELIYYNDMYEMIHHAISQDLKLKIYLPKSTKKSNSDDSDKHGKNKIRKGYLSPYNIYQDKAGINNYLVGVYEELYDDAVMGERKIVSIKLSKILKMVLMRSMKSRISESEQIEIEKDLLEKGPEFMKGKLLTIKVKFTDDGLRDFFKKLYFRPKSYKKVEGEENVYIVKCTPKQAENYFFPFGRDVTILEPIILQKLFGLWYESANEHYQALAKEREKDARMIEDEPALLEALNEAAPASDVSTIAAKRGFRISNSPNIDDDDVISEPSDKP